MKPFLDSTDCVDDGAELVRRMERDGYLFVRNLLPAHPLTSLRRRFLELARDGGWVATEAPLEEAEEFLDRMREEGRACLVHCFEGMNRSAAS